MDGWVVVFDYASLLMFAEIDFVLDCRGRGSVLCIILLFISKLKRPVLQDTCSFPIVSLFVCIIKQHSILFPPQPTQQGSPLPLFKPSSLVNDH